jgi:hypothetical protein
MGRFITGGRSKNLIETKEYSLSQNSIKLLNYANYLVEKTKNNVFIALDLSDKNNNKDYSTLVVSEVIGEKINVLQCINENNVENLSDRLTELIDKIREN